MRLVADGDRVGLMVNQEKSIERIFGWLDTMDHIATALEDAVRTGILPAGKVAQTSEE